jgi:hypothetical protein
MKYKYTLLNISALIFLVGILITTIAKYKVLSAGEGWGIVAMVGLAGIGFLAIVVDFFLQLVIKNKKILNIIEAMVLIGAALSIIYS